MGGVKFNIELHLCMIRKKIAQNYKKICTYAIRTRIFLRKVSFLGYFFTQSNIIGVIFST